jgi:hypothetical protein
LTTSLNSSFDPQATTVIKTALQLCQVLNAALEPDPDQLAMGMTLLDLMLKALQNDGVLQRQTVRTTVQVSAISAGVITADTDTVDIEGIYYTDTAGNDVPISTMTRRAWMDMGSKTLAGAPSMAFVEKANGIVTINLFPIGDGSVVSVTYAKVRRVRDVDTAGVTLDIPPLWHRCVVYGLAADFALHYGRVDRADMLRGIYEAEKARALDNDGERGDSRFVVGERFTQYG